MIVAYTTYLKLEYSANWENYNTTQTIHHCWNSFYVEYLVTIFYHYYGYAALGFDIAVTLITILTIHLVTQVMFI